MGCACFYMHNRIQEKNYSVLIAGRGINLFF